MGKVIQYCSNIVDNGRRADFSIILSIQVLSIIYVMAKLCEESAEAAAHWVSALTGTFANHMPCRW